MTTRDEFAKSVVASGLLSADDLQTFWQRIPAPQRPKDGETLGAILVQQSRLTEYQKQELLAGRGKNLILGNYVILDKLGQGGMGMVLKAEHKRMRRCGASCKRRGAWSTRIKRESSTGTSSPTT